MNSHGCYASDSQQSIYQIGSGSQVGITPSVIRWMSFSSFEWILLKKNENCIPSLN